MTYPHYSSFTEFMKEYVIPRKYGPDERLDQRDNHGNPVLGRAPKGNPVPAATFEHDKLFWDIHLDTWVRPLNIAYKEITQNHTNPFQQEFTKRKRKDGRNGICLVLREDLWPPNEYKLMYIFQVQDRGVHIHVFK